MVNRRYRNEQRPLRRRRPFLEPRKRILIVCEGKVTEPQYFEAFSQEERNRLVDVVIDDASGVPKTLVERAVQRKKRAEQEAKHARDDNLKYDEVWCVFDVDQHPNLPDARQQARDNEIKLAVSNPCFELWLLLHFSEQTAHIERHVAASSLRTHIRGYRKHVPFDKLRSGYEDAVRRAKLLERRATDSGDESGNPSTKVYCLTERIIQVSQEARSPST
ncbi:MAG TPA: RloB family protein [Pyrinomonadaceae bacterium]|nr:RloB family protein [Pyrinomonadaceae bacterium]